ncbi:NACHT domain-containing protein [Sinorhizobium chiapasense]|uniref:NACHT domain-containing protein n=1 Tax=Sinorhizobium chiapasense TaxID=501572 RepID=A0ABZ2B9J4_9HYPH
MNISTPLFLPSSDTYIDLCRTLRDIHLAGDLTDDVDLLRMKDRGVGHTWENLVNEKRVVVLAEAGAGKTWEIRELARKLRDEGREAFFIRLELIPHNFDISFEEGMYARFQAWLSGQDEGWLLLDSVDESRLRDPGDFEIAVRRLSSVLGPAKVRSHIVLTSRVGAWRPKTDLSLCSTHLPHPSPAAVAVGTGSVSPEPDIDLDSDDDLDGYNELFDDVVPTKQASPADQNATAGFRILSLEDLDTSQVRLFLTARDVEDADAFIREVDRRDAQAFTARPQDLDEVVDFWRANGRIGSHLEMMRASLSRRLAEHDQRRADVQGLSEERARAGARSLAAAATLTGVPVIRVPDGNSSSGGIPASAILRDWGAAEITALLQLPVFDGAIYGTVRFHHRSVREYLAAEWFADLLGRAPSRLGLEQLFFRKQYGIEILTPILRPVLPWLVLLDEGICVKVLNVCPDAALEGGDPSQLPVNDRRKILAAVCEQLASGTGSRSGPDFEAVQRFASDDIADDVRSLLNQYRDHEEVAPFLLRMVWIGRLRVVIPEVLQFATNPTPSGYRRLTALRALNAIGLEEEIAHVREALLVEGQIDRKLLSELVSELPSTRPAVTWLLAAVEATAPKVKFHTDDLTRQLTLFVKRSAPGECRDLVIGFERLLSRPPFVERIYNEVSQTFEWLLTPAAAAVRQLAESRDPASLSTPSLSVIRRVSGAIAFQSDEVRDGAYKLDALVVAWPDLNRAQFWYDVGQMRGAMANRSRGQLIDWWLAKNVGAPWIFGVDDFDFAIDAMSSRDLMDDRLVGLSLAFEIYASNGRPRRWLTMMKRAAAVQPELAARLSTFLHPPHNPEAARYRANERQRVRRLERRRAEEADNEQRARDYLQANVGQIRADLYADPTLVPRSRAVRYLFDKTQESNRESGYWSDGNWRSLIESFGGDVAVFFKDMALGHWRNNTPILCSEGAPAHETPFVIILGLAGLAIEAVESPENFVRLSPPEVETACRHALWELNGFPTWLSIVYRHNIHAVTALFLNEIRYELTLLPSGDRSNDVLRRVSSSGEWAWDTLAPPLAELIAEAEPADARALGKILKILRGSSLSDGQLAHMARLRCIELRGGTHPALWFAMWIGLEGSVAVEALSSHLSELGEEAATNLAMEIAVNLFGSRFDHDPVARDGVREPSTMRKLHEVFSKYIRRADDINRANSGVYSPGLRDNAQDARDSILNSLEETPGKDAFLAIREIVRSQPDRPWLQRLVIEKAERAGDIERFTAEEIPPLAENFERLPRSPRQLGDTAVLRLGQLKERVEVKGDIGVEALDIDDVSGVTALLEAHLRGRALGTYSLLSTTDDRRGATISLHGVGYNGCQPAIALLPNLVNGKKTDLASSISVLADNSSSRTGVVAVFNLAKSKGWHWPWLARPDISKAVSTIKAEWEKLEPGLENLDDVGIVGIDLTKVALPENRKRDALDRMLDFLRWYTGTTLMKIGAAIVASGLGTITGVLQFVIEWAVAYFWEIKLDIPEQASWIGWALLAIGLAVAFYGHHQRPTR